ncbi:MAG: hypothetical protein QXI19_06305 [Candidatus Caldarchaeum sp.]
MPYHTYQDWLRQFTYTTVPLEGGRSITVYGTDVIWRPLRNIFAAGFEAWKGKNPVTEPELTEQQALRTWLALPLVEARGYWSPTQGYPINIRGAAGEVGQYQIHPANVYRNLNTWGVNIYDLATNPLLNAQTAYRIYAQPAYYGGFAFNWPNTYRLLQEQPQYYYPYVDEWLGSGMMNQRQWAQHVGVNPDWLYAPTVNTPEYQSGWVATPEGNWVWRG